VGGEKFYKILFYKVQGFKVMIVKHKKADYEDYAYSGYL